MKITIDTKSAVCGLLAGVAAVLTIGAGDSSNQVGKYRVATGVSDGKGYAIMVDTQTGKAWGYTYGAEAYAKVVQPPGAFQSSAEFWKEK
jgi:hypothetical protein